MKIENAFTTNNFKVANRSTEVAKMWLVGVAQKPARNVPCSNWF